MQDVLPGSLLLSIDTKQESPRVANASKTAMKALLSDADKNGQMDSLTIGDAVTRIDRLLEDLAEWKNRIQQLADVQLPRQVLESERGHYGALYGRLPGTAVRVIEVSPIDLGDNGNRFEGPLTALTFRTMLAAPALVTALTGLFRKLDSDHSSEPEEHADWNRLRRLVNFVNNGGELDGVSGELPKTRKDG